MPDIDIIRTLAGVGFDVFNYGEPNDKSEYYGDEVNIDNSISVPAQLGTSVEDLNLPDLDDEQARKSREMFKHKFYLNFCTLNKTFWRRANLSTLALLMSYSSIT